MKRTSKKAERLLRIEQLLLAHPNGISRAEMGRKLDVHRSTIKRDVDDLGKRLPIWEHDNLIGINRDDYLTSVRLNIHESMALHLSARLMATRMDKHNPHAASALRKFAEALRLFSPQISGHLLASADVMDGDDQHRDPVYSNVLETLTQAWSQGKMVHVWHRYKKRTVEYDFAPYFIEPYAVGQTTHVIGLREPPGEIRTFKVERIQRIEMLKDRSYEIPEDFDARALLKDAWGIWFTDKEPEEVVLRFHARVARRVQETRWHPSQTVEMEPNGYLLWRAKVAEWQEMVHWIRGWGADVEVLAPQRLREMLMGEAKAMAELYRWHVSSGGPTGGSSVLDDFFGG